MYFEEVFYTHQKVRLNIFLSSNVARILSSIEKKIIIIVKIIVLITILAKTSLDTSRVFYFYKIRCGILLHSIKCMTYHMDCPFSYNRKWLCAHTVKSYLGILLTDTFKCLCQDNSLHLSLTLLLFNFCQINKH